MLSYLLHNAPLICYLIYMHLSGASIYIYLYASILTYMLSYLLNAPRADS